MDKFNYFIRSSITALFCAGLVIAGFGQASIPTVYLNIKGGNTVSHDFVGSTSMQPEFILLPDASIGSASFDLGQNNNISMIFDALPNALGMTEIIMEYYTLGQNSHPITKRFVIEVSTSFVQTANDYLSVYKNSSDTLISVLDNDLSDSNDLVIKNIIVSSNGLTSISTDQQTISFRPIDDFVGMAYVTYLACDGLDNCGMGEVAIDVVEMAGNAVSDEVSIHITKGQSAQLSLPESGFSNLVYPSNGSISNLGPSLYQYLPQSDFIGNDTIVFENNSGISRSFFIQVHEKDIHYHAMDDRIYTRPDSSVIFNVLENDVITYPIMNFTSPKKGTLVDLGNGEFQYTPTNSNYRGVDAFTYTTCFEGNVYCETAQVQIHVGNLYPQTERVYRFKTLKNVELPVKYEIPFQDFSIQFSTSPDHGTFPLWPGFAENQLVECQSISGFNILRYIPDEDFVGTDYAEFYHWGPNGIGALVRVEIEVIDPVVEVTCPCVDDCVWSGDANNDGIVNMQDLLTLGWYLGEYGTPRSSLGLGTWYGEHGDNWMIDQPFTGSNIKFADADGDGVLSFNDTSAIAEMYHNTHSLVPDDQQPKAPYSFGLGIVQFGLDSGDLVVLNILIGNEQNPVLDMHGVSFSVNIPTWMLDSSSMKVEFHNDSWLASGGTSLNMDAVPYDGRVDAALTRGSGNVVSGYGVVATLSFIVEDDIEGIRSDSDEIPINIKLDDGISYSANGEKVKIPGDTFTYILKLNGGNKENIDLEKTVRVYPNPTEDYLNIHVNGENSIQSIELYNLSGQLMFLNKGVDSKQFNTSIQHYNSGLYIARVITEKGTITKKFEKF